MRSLLFPDTFFTAFDSSPFLHERNSSSLIEENDSGYFIQLDMPGVKRENVKVTIEGRTLYVEGERAGRPKMRRAFSLPSDVAADKIKAQLLDGVFELELPKAEEAKPKEISVSDGKESLFAKLLPNKE